MIAGDAALFRIASVDQQRLAVRGDEHRATAAFDIDRNHLQGGVLGRRGRHGQQQGERN